MLPLNTSQIPGLFRNARAQEQAGKLDEACRGYENILRLDRAHAPARFQLGQVLYKQGKLSAAIDHLDQAAAARPGEPAIWQLYGRAVADLGDPQVTRGFLNKAKSARLDRNLYLALQNLFHQIPKKTKISIGDASPRDVKRAIDLLQAGRHADVIRLAGRLRKSHPDVAIVADILALAQATTGAYESAEDNFRAAQRLDPAYAETRSNYGRFLVERGRYVEAIEELQKALQKAPALATAMVHLGIALKRNQDTRKAAVALRKALEYQPKSAEALMELGQILVGENEPEEAVELLERAGANGADEVEVLLWSARALPQLGRDDDALKLLERALEIAPENADALFAQAQLFQTLGRFDDARAAFRRAINILPRAGRFYRSFLTSEKLAPDDPLFAQMEHGFADPDISDEARFNFGFALAKAMEDSKQFDRVFTYLKPANDLVRKAFPFKFDALRDQTRDLIDSLREVEFETINIPDRSDYAPIFVSGLPRSGTTLVEQIVASHSAVTGGGELGFARQALGDLLIDSDGAVRSWKALGEAQIAEAGHLAEARMRARFGDAARVTDKSVQSYSMIGPIRAALPNARFVVVRRDPRDNLLSMYKNLFAAGKHLHSYDLRDLARYYLLFEEIMDFWRAKTPGWFHEIRYERLIGDPEAEARKLIAACGLDWEDQCLSFYENKRRVDTLSVHQVRQPIYASSMQAWRRYETELTEMLEELGGEYAPGAS